MSSLYLYRLFFLLIFLISFDLQLQVEAVTLQGDQTVKGHVKVIPTKYLKVNNICSNTSDSDVNFKLFDQGLSVFYTDSLNKKKSLLYIDKNGITAHKAFTCDGVFNQTGSGVFGALEVTGSAVFDGDVTLKKGMVFAGPITVAGASTITGSVTLGSASASSLLATSSNIYVDGTVAIGLTAGNHANKIIKTFQHVFLVVFCSGIIYEKAASSVVVPFNYTVQLIHFPIPGPSGGSIFISESTNFPVGCPSYTITATAYQKFGSEYSFALTTSGPNVVAVGSFLIETKSAGVIRICNAYFGTPI